MPDEAPLWPDLDAGQEAVIANPWDGTPVVTNVARPTLTSVLPAPGTETGTAVIVCPGGAFHFLSMESEGLAPARWLAERGHAAHVLKYRLVATPDDPAAFSDALVAFMGLPEPARRAWLVEHLLDQLLADGRRALELVRPTAERVVMLGFSAGARLVAEVLRSGPGPDAAGLVYLPWVEEGITAGPPLFLLAAGDDPLGIDGSLDLHRVWREAGRPVELHLYERGGHGFGMHPTDLPVGRWIERFQEWLGTR